jgi:hypothetical protein
MNGWTLTTENGTEKTFADWGICNPNRDLFNQETSTFTFTQNAEYDATPIAAYKSLVTIKMDGAIKFRGRLIDVEPDASSRAESISYMIADVWFDLKNSVFQKTCKILSNPLDAASPLTDIYSSHFLMNLSATGVAQTIPEQLNEVLQYAKDNGAEMQFNVSPLPELFLPFDEVTEIPCSEAIVRELKWCPDVSTWLDFTTTPPSLNARRRADCAVKTIDVKTVKVLGKIKIVPRYDLLVPSVVIKYERVNELDGVSWLDFGVDAVPANATGRELGALVATINLEGTVASTALATVESTAFDISNKEWWKIKCPELAADSIKDLAITDATREGGLPLEFVNGQIADWMPGIVEEELVEAVASYKQMAEDGITPLKVVTGQTVHTRIRSTNLVSGTYRTESVSVAGESAPVGLAQALYVAASTLHYDGTITIQEDECSGSISIGDVLNIVNGRKEWATMNAQVQSLSEDIDSGTTTIRIGPPKFLGRDEIMALLKVTRQRRRYTPTSAFTSGRSASANREVSLGRSTPRENSVSGQPNYDKFTIGQNIVIDVADLLGRGAKFEEESVCVNGEQWFRKFLCTPRYKK